jgi:hypothetical protein
MFVFALLFASLAVLGAAIGLGHVGHPINGQSIESYGWALFINGLAIAIFLTLRAALAPLERKILSKPRLAHSSGQVLPDRRMGGERTSTASKAVADVGRWQNARPAPVPSQVTVVLPDDPEAILDALVERVGTAGVDLMLRNRNRASIAETAA